MLVVPGHEPLEFVPEGDTTQGNQQSACALALHGPDEPFDHRDAPMFPDGAIPRPDLPAPAPGFKAAAPELHTFVTDEVSGLGRRESDRSPEKRADRS